MSITPVVAREAITQMTWLLTAWAIIQGALTIAAGPERWSQPQYAAAMSVPAAPTSWGILLAGAGIIMGIALIGRHRALLATATIIAGFWNGALALFTLTAYLEHPGVPLTSAANWSCLGIAYLIVAMAWADRDGDREEVLVARVLSRFRGRDE